MSSVFPYVFKSSFKRWFLVTVSFSILWVHHKYSIVPLLLDLCFSACDYFKLFCNKLRKSLGTKGTHSKCASFRKSTPMQGFSLENSEKTQWLVSTIFSWVVLPNICSLIHYALERTRATVRWRLSFSRRAEYSSAGIHWVPTAVASAAERTRALPWAQERSQSNGENRGSTYFSFSIQDRKKMIVVIVAQFYEYNKNHRILYFKRMNVIVREL